MQTMSIGGENIKLKNKKKIQINKEWIGLLYISPWLIGFLVFQLYPFISSFAYSLTDFNMLRAPKFIGFKNYIYMFKDDPLFYQSLKVTFKYVFFSVPCKIVFALIVAMILNMKVKGINIFRTVYYLPSILGGSVSISILWRLFFMRDGVINILLSVFNIPPLDWLGNPDTALITISLLSVWQFGSSMVIFLAGLKQIPAELYEAASVDGASKVRMFFVITLPMISSIMLFNLIMQLINAFQEFTGAFIITNGGPLNSTYMYGMMLYENAFKFFKMGYSSALSWILFIIMMVFTLILFKTSNAWTYYEDGGDF